MLNLASKLVGVTATAFLILAAIGSGQDVGQPRPPRDAAPKRAGLVPQKKSYVAGESLADLAQVPSVAAELKASPDQLREIRNQTSDHFRRGIAANRALVSALERGESEQAAAAQRSLDESHRLSDDAVRRGLKPAQMHRLLQIACQKEGVRAIFRPEIGRYLQIDDDQYLALQEVVASGEAEAARVREERLQAVSPETEARHEGLIRRIVDSKSTEALGAGDKAFLARQAEIGRRYETEDRKTERRYDQDLLQVLTKAQKTRFLKLYGEPFDLDTLTREHLVKSELSKAAGDAAKPAPAPR